MTASKSDQPTADMVACVSDAVTPRPLGPKSWLMGFDPPAVFTATGRAVRHAFSANSFQIFINFGSQRNKIFAQTWHGNAFSVR